MEKDQAGNIIRFDDRDHVTFEGYDCVIDLFAAESLNYWLDAIKQGDMSKQMTARRTVSLIRWGCAELHCIVNPLELFEQLPVDLSRINQ